MSDVKKLKDCIEEFRKANTGLDEKLNKIEENKRRTRREAEEQSRH